MLGYPKQMLEAVQEFSTTLGPISFILKRTERRTLAIEIKQDGQVFVAAPFSLKEKEILSFLNKKSHWIFKKKEDVKKRNQENSIRKYEDEEEFLFLGKKCRLYIYEEQIKQSRIYFDGILWRVFIPTGLSLQERQKKIKETLSEWYRKQAEEILGGRLFHYTRILRVEPQKIAIKTQKRLWGICDYHKKIIRLNWLIILAPMNVIDYVIVHELCHLLIPNHSRAFWKKVETVYPQYQECRQWLKKNQSQLLLP